MDQVTPAVGRLHPEPRLLEQAVADRDAHPWRYYRFEWEDAQRWLDRLADRAEKAEAAVRAAREIAPPAPDLARLKAEARAEEKPAGWSCPVCGLDDARYYVDQLMRLKELERIAPPAQTWQPIETAPIDGTVILVCDGKNVWTAKTTNKWGRLAGWMPLPPAPPQAPEQEK